MNAPQSFVNDLSGLNPVPVWVVTRPNSVEEVQEAVRRTAVPVSVGGGHFSLGGQTASQGSLHLDMRGMNRVLFFAPQERLLRVEAGIRWCDIQKFIDPHHLSVSIMQDWANFTVGGSLASCAHGAGVGQGPVIDSVRALRLVLPDGELVEASAEHNAHLFHAAIGGFAAIGIIVEIELFLTDNLRLERKLTHLAVADYAEWFGRQVRNAPGAIFHRAELLAPHWQRVRAITWSSTARPVTEPLRLRPWRRPGWLTRWLCWQSPGNRAGIWLRERLAEGLRGLRPVRWRNFEAGADLALLEPHSRKQQTGLMQEYFIPARRLDEFLPRLRKILHAHDVAVRSLVLRHVTADSGTLLAWARGETFAVMLHYRQPLRASAMAAAAVWTRELIDAALETGGSYNLAFQPQATPEQFHQAYPRARELFALKRDLDPDYRLRSLLWDKYYAPGLRQTEAAEPSASRFRRVFADTALRDDCYRFLLQQVHPYPAARLHTLIRDACREHEDDASIYRSVQQALPQIRPALADLRYALPGMRHAQQALGRQLPALLGERRNLSGCIEIGSPGRLLNALRGLVRLRGEQFVFCDDAPQSGLAGVLARGGIARADRLLPLADYAPIPPELVRDNSLDMVCCDTGLHPIHPPDLAAFLASVHRVLRPGGLFVLREYDADTAARSELIALAHALTHLAAGLGWEQHLDAAPQFRSLADWVQRLDAAGFSDTGARLCDAQDPTRRTLMAFTKRGLS